MSILLVTVFVVGALALARHAARALEAARRAPGEVVARAQPLGLAATLAALAALAAWTWGGAVARRGDARLDARGGGTAVATLRHVALPDGGAIGWAPGVALRLPAHELDEARGGRALFAIDRPGAPGDASLRVRAALDASSPTRLVAWTSPAGAAPATLARRAVRAGCAGAAAALDLALDPARDVATVVACDGDRAALAFVVDGDGVTPFVRRGRDAAPYRTELAPRAVVQLGDAAGAVPGLALWELPAAPGQLDLLAVPSDVRAPCTAWADGAAAAISSSRDAACEVRTASGHRLELRPLVPDVVGVTARAGWAAAVLVLPVVLALLALAARARGEIDRARVARLAALGWLAIVLAALAAWRLVWAHRVDVLREHEAVAARVLLAQWLVVVTGAAVAGLAVAASLPVARVGRGARVTRVGAVAAAHLAWLAIGAVALRADAAAVLAHRAALPLAAASLGLALVVAAPPRPPRLPAYGWLVALAAAAVATRALAPGLVAAKLALAAVAPLALHAGLTAAAASRSRGPALAALAAAGLAAAALLALDAGVAVAVAGPGAVVAAVLVTHAQLYAARDARLLDRWERRQWPLTLGHAALLAGGALAAAVAAAVAGAPGLPAEVTAHALHLPALLALAFAASAAVAWRRAGAAAARIPATCAVLAAAVWLGRGAALDRAVGADDTAGRRVAAVVAPGYALLRDERSFAAVHTAWRETAVAGGALDGEGYFAARIADPGVSLSIENDYLPVLLVREVGVVGVAATVALLLVAIGGAWWLGTAACGHASDGARRRALAALGLGAITVYQPLAALGLLPQTGVTWPGLGLDSPSDAFVHLAWLTWLAWPAAAAPVPIHDLAVRATPRWRRARLVTAGAAAIAAATGVALVARGAAFAAGRGRDAAPAAPAMERAAAYARGLGCPAPVGRTEDVVPRALLGIPRDADTARFHAEADARVRSAASAGRAAAAAVHAGAPCAGRRGAWRLTPAASGACALALDLGWPELRVTVTPGAAIARCEVAVSDDVLAPLRPRPTPPRRIRVVGAAAGVAAADRAEVIGAAVVVRVRAGAPALALDGGDVTGLRAAATVALAPGVEVAAGEPSATLTITPGAAARAWRPDGARWRPVALDAPRPLTGVTVVVAGVGAARRAWLVRGPDVTGGAVPPLLADDAGAARRYVHGGALPELGWRNPHAAGRGLGLDGWIHAAVAEGAHVTRPATSPACGTLDPPPPTAPVCATSPADGVLECRVALDPELALTLRALTELVALDPATAVGQGAPATRAAFTLLRGDTGELLAAGDFVPGRAGSAYAPATPALARALAALREAPGEASAEKYDLHRPIAIGSTWKPLLARAAEQVDPARLASLQLAIGLVEPATCRRGARAVSRLLGHCPPTELLGRTERGGWLDVHDHLARSSNSFQAALGVLALAWPDGGYRVDGVEVGAHEVVAADVLAWDRPLEVVHDDRRVLGPRGVRLDALRATPLWQRIEALAGRPLCTLGSKAACVAASDRRDLCAARALPVAAPSADLRHLVALGPSMLDIYPPGADAAARAVPVTEYLQLLRGAGVHPYGSLAQLADMFNRIVFDPGEGGAMRLAASWFPAPTAGRLPAAGCTAGGGHAAQVRGDAGGLCGAVRDGGTAARAMAPLLADPRVTIYGAKTGTIDTLADVSERRARCEAWNRAHTLPDRPARASAQPYWLACGEAARDDSLFVVSFAVHAPSGPVPLTLAVHFERSGKSVAALAAALYVQALAARLAPEAAP